MEGVKNILREALENLCRYNFWFDWICLETPMHLASTKINQIKTHVEVEQRWGSFNVWLHFLLCVIEICFPLTFLSVRGGCLYHYIESFSSSPFVFHFFLLFLYFPFIVMPRLTTEDMLKKLHCLEETKKKINKQTLEKETKTLQDVPNLTWALSKF